MSTKYNGIYQNHKIRLENTLGKIKLYIDGQEADLLKGLRPRDDAKILRAKIQDENEDINIEVFIENTPIKKGILGSTAGFRFIIKINGSFFDTGFINNRQQKKYGKFLSEVSNSAK